MNKRSSTTALGALLLAAAVSLPAFAASPYESFVAKGVSWLTFNQNIDGSWGWDSAVAPPATAEAVIALRAINYRTPAYYWGIAWLENHNAANVDYQSRRILALAANGDNVQSGQQYLQAAQSTAIPGNGGWGLNATYEGAPLDTALALQAYKQLNVSTGVSSALGYLKTAQLTGTDKGWAFGQDIAASDPAVTAQVVVALSAYKAGDPTLVTPVNNGVAALTSRVTTASSTYLKALAALALLRAGSNANTYLASLTASQWPDGSFDGDPYITAVALRALAAAMGTDAPNWGDVVLIPDANLRAAINGALGRNSMDALNKGELARLTTLTAAGRGIANLAGLEWAVNLTYLDVRNNNITSTAPIAALTQLTTTLLAGNPVYVPPNRAPVLVADSAAAVGGYPMLLYVLSNDADPDGDPISLVSTTGAAHGVVQVVGATIKYTANDAYAGADSFSYTAKDSKGATATTTVTLTVYGKSGDEDGDGVGNFDEMTLTRNIFVNENAILLLLRKALKM